MKKGLLYGIVLGILLFGLAGCKEYQPLATKGDAVSGQAAGVKKPVKEPSVDEIERAFHNAIQHEVYRYGDRDEEFSGRDMELYCKKEKDCYKYYLVDKISEDGETYYNYDVLCYYTDCEEPGFETTTDVCAVYTKKELREELDGAVKVTELKPWKYEKGKRPDYPKMSKETRKIVKQIEDKVKEEARKYCVVGEKKDCHVYISQFVPADRTVELLLVIDEEKGEKKAGVCIKEFDLHPVVTYAAWLEEAWSEDERNNRLTDSWMFAYGKYRCLDEYAMGETEKEMIAHAMTDFTFSLEPRKSLSEQGITDEVQQQIKRIAQERNRWSAPRLGNYNLYYMISDLNQNKRLEVVVCKLHNSVIDTYAYEISKDGRLVKCGKEGNGFDFSRYSQVDAYYSPKENVYYYRSQLRYGDPKGVREVPGDFSLQGDTIKQRQFDAGKIWDDELTTEKGYMVGEKRATRETYEKAVDKHWRGMEKKRASFGWYSDGAMKDMDEKELEARLARSFLDFAITG